MQDEIILNKKEKKSSCFWILHFSTLHSAAFFDQKEAQIIGILSKSNLNSGEKVTTYYQNQDCDDPQNQKIGEQSKVRDVYQSYSQGIDPVRKWVNLSNDF